MNVNEWIASKRKRAKPVRTWNGSTQAPTIRNGKLILASPDDAPSEQATTQVQAKRTSKSGPTAEAAEELRRLWAEDDKRGGPMF